MSELLPCPFCRSFYLDNLDGTHIHCIKCGAAGPQTATPHEAWNRRFHQDTTLLETLGLNHLPPTPPAPAPFISLHGRTTGTYRFVLAEPSSVGHITVDALTEWLAELTFMLKVASGVYYHPEHNYTYTHLT